MSDANAGVRIQALQSIATIGVKAVAIQPAIISVVRKDSVSVKVQAIQTLASVDPIAARPLVETFIGDKNPDLVSAGVASLGILGTDTDIAKILPYLQNPATFHLDR